MSKAVLRRLQRLQEQSKLDLPLLLRSVLLHTMLEAGYHYAEQGILHGDGWLIGIALKELVLA